MSNKESSDIKLIQLNSYVRPKVIENKGRDWVMNGKKNIFYQYIIDRYNGSPTNASIINSYVDLIYGKGITSNNKKHLKMLNEMLNSDDLRRIISDFELFGEASIQVIPKRDKLNLPELKHIAKNKVIPSIEDEEGNINDYWFSKDWNNQYKEGNEPEKIPVFGTQKGALQIYNIKPYKAGKNYFSDPDYLAGLPYAEMEEEIANYCINHIQNGLSFGYIINIPNGANWTTEQRQQFEVQLKQKLTGSNNAGKFVIAFNGLDMEVNVVPLEVNSAHKQWDFLTQESKQQLLTAHRVTSPMLFGIKDNTGLGNNANELDVAEAQLYKRVIAPKQKYITDALSDIMRFYGQEAEFYFIPLTETNIDSSKSFDGSQISSVINIIDKVNSGLLTSEQGKSLLTSMLSYPIEEVEKIFKEQPNKNKTVVNDEDQDTQLNQNCCSHVNLKEDEDDYTKHLNSVVDAFIESGEDESELEKEYELVSEDSEDFSIQESQLNNIVKLARTPFSTPKRKSEQDTSLFKIRYKYKGSKNPEREFCRKVMKSDRVYRWEDLEVASTKAVNPGLGKDGAKTYDIAKYKGGVYCKHFWQRKIYLRRNNKAISVNQARKIILQLPPKEREDAKWEKNPKEVAQVAQPSNNYWKAN